MLSRDLMRQGFTKFTASMASQGRWTGGQAGRGRKSVRRPLEPLPQGIKRLCKNSGRGGGGR